MRKILIVEDSETDEAILLSLLSSYGICHTIDSADGALRLLEQSFREGEPYTIVVIDLLLKDGDGLPVLGKLREMEAGKPAQQRATVLMVSGMSDATVVTNAKHLGCDAFIRKPIAKDVVLSELQSLLGESD